MRIYEGLFSWEGFGGVYQLAAGQCRLWIFDLSKDPHSKVALMKPFVVVVSDQPDPEPKYRKMSVRSCAGHIATGITAQFQIDPQRMIYVEYHPQSVYGDQGQHLIPATFEAVDFVWHDVKALHPKWRPLDASLQDTLVELMATSGNNNS